MTGFSADWLTLREPFDMRARNPSVLDAVAHYLATYPSVRIVDLACGTGSTLRALSARIPSRQNWNLVDNDLSLLARATATEHRDNVVVSGIPLDLNRDLEAALDGPVDLVTTSALLDLVSESWLERLTVEIAARAIPFGVDCGPALRVAHLWRMEYLRAVHENRSYGWRRLHRFYPGRSVDVGWALGHGHRQPERW